MKYNNDEIIRFFEDAGYNNVEKEVVIMAYIRKTVDRWDIMSNYGYGWECECSEYTFKEAKQRLKEYRENGSGCYRLEKRREKKEVKSKK